MRNKQDVELVWSRAESKQAMLWAYFFLAIFHMKMVPIFWLLLVVNYSR